MPKANPAIAYAVVPKEEETELSSVYIGEAVSFPEMIPNYAHGQVSSTWTHLPETHHLSWDDDFFDNEDGVVAVFDLDYDAMEVYYSKVGWGCYASTLCCPNIFTLATIAMTPCYLGRNVEWNVRSQHVAITRDGIRFVQERRPTCWGMSCTDAGKRSKTVSVLCLQLRVIDAGAEELSLFV
jgi:hypothetical protein